MQRFKNFLSAVKDGEDTDSPTWFEDTEYRLRTDYTIELNAHILNNELFIDVGARFPNMSLVFDATTSELKSVEMIKWKGKK